MAVQYAWYSRNFLSKTFQQGEQLVLHRSRCVCVCVCVCMFVSVNQGQLLNVFCDLDQLRPSVLL